MLGFWRENMGSVQVVMLALLTLASIFLGYVALMNVVSCLPESLWPRERTLFAATVLVLAGPAFCLALLVSVEIALIAISIGGFGCGLVAYFLGQRFESPVFSSNLVRRRPTFFPMVTLVFLSFSMSFLGMSKGWMWDTLLIPFWLVLGYVSAELAIRREQIRSAKYKEGFDRGMAIFAINEYQGRGGASMFEARPAADRYPFP
jgi:hypothetical protein